MSTHKHRVLVLHGPNLNLLGTREPHIYGGRGLDEVDGELVALGEAHGAEVVCRQSNSEGELVDWIQEAADFDALLINPAAYTHTSVAIRDAIASLDVPCVEIHITNVYQRERFRHTSYCAAVVDARIMGFGTAGYGLALRGVLERLGSAAGRTRSAPPAEEQETTTDV